MKFGINFKIPTPKTYLLNTKEKFCDKVIIFLASIIRKCAVQEKFERHLKRLEENQTKSTKFEHIESKKEQLHEAIIQVQNNSKELFEIHKVIAKSLQDIRVDVVCKNNDKAILKLDEILRFYDEKLQIKKGV